MWITRRPIDFCFEGEPRNGSRNPNGNAEQILKMTPKMKTKPRMMAVESPE
jgi:hypothetical protein